MDPKFRGAHYAARSIWWCAGGVKSITSGFSIFFCEALPFIQPSWKAIRSSGIRVVEETTGLPMAARWHGRSLQPGAQRQGKTQNCTDVTTTSVSTLCLKIRASPFTGGNLWSDHQCRRYLQIIPLQKSGWGWELGAAQANSRSKAHRILMGWEPFTQNKPQNPRRGKTLKTFPVY